MKVKSDKPAFLNTYQFWPLLIIGLFAFLLYGNTLYNDYCLDDSIVINQNSFTQSGIYGIGDIFSNESFTGFFGKEKQLVTGGRYRPLSIATFALEYQFLGTNPHVSHLINVVLYVFTAYLVFLILCMLCPETVHRKWYSGFAFLTAIMFLVHPVHTEVIANIKGRDEILALLFSLLALWQALLYLKSNKQKHLFLSALFFLPALFSKEHALAFLVIIPSALLLFHKASPQKATQIFFILLVPALIFLLVRQAVLGHLVQVSSNELMNNSFLGATPSQHYATVFYTLGKYLQLLVFPHPLTYDYYPYHIRLLGWNNVISLLALLFYISFFIFSLTRIRRQPLILFSVLLFSLPLLPVSNIFFPVGTFMSERFLYIPSLGFCVIATSLVSRGINSSKGYIRKYSVIMLVIVVCLLSMKTISRNFVWKDDLTLFTTDVLVSQNSAKGNCAAGGILYDTYKNEASSHMKAEKIAEAIRYLKKAIVIHPLYDDAWLLLGNAYTLYPDSLSTAMYCYEKILAFSPGNDKALQNIEYIVGLEKNPSRKVALLEHVLKYEPGSYLILFQLGNTWGKELQNIPKATQYLEKALEINPLGKEAMRDLGVAYAIQKDFRRSASILEKIVAIDSLDINSWINLGLTYRNMGETLKARACFDKARRLQAKKPI